jgi:hypothetical protein
MNSKVCTCKNCFNNAMIDRDVCFNCDRAVTGFTGTLPENKTTLPYHIPSTIARPSIDNPERHRASDRSLAARYPQYYKPVGDLKEVDVYAVCQLFPVDDPSGCINHARKKLLIPGVRTGGKSMRKDVQEAIDSLNRWMQLNPEPAEKMKAIDLTLQPK